MTNPTLIFLDHVRHNLDHVDYSLIYQSIKDLRHKMIPTALLKKGCFIDRVRPNENGETFSNIEQVSYIHDKDILANRVVYGRANQSKQAVFYGSILSPKISKPRAIAYFETSKLIKEIDSHKVSLQPTPSSKNIFIAEKSLRADSTWLQVINFDANSLVDVPIFPVS